MKGGNEGVGCQLNLFFKILETHSWIKCQLNLIKTGTTPFSRLRLYNCPVLIWGLLNMILPKQRGHLIILSLLIIFYQHCIAANLTGLQELFIKFNVDFWFNNFYAGISSSHCVWLCLIVSVCQTKLFPMFYFRHLLSPPNCSKTLFVARRNLDIINVNSIKTRLLFKWLRQENISDFQIRPRVIIILWLITDA